MISDKMKEDAAKIDSEIKIIATRMPLLYHNYDYLNEDVKVVLKRRNQQLDKIKCVKAFLNENVAFTEALGNCEKTFNNINEELKRLGVDIMLKDNVNHSGDSSADKNTYSDDDEPSGMIGHSERKNVTISRENSFVPDTPAIKYRKNLNL